jgi:hypothetical protein
MGDRRSKMRAVGIKLMDRAAYLQFAIEIIRRSDDQKGFEVLPRRWVVERGTPRSFRNPDQTYSDAGAASSLYQSIGDHGAGTNSKPFPVLRTWPVAGNGAL